MCNQTWQQGEAGIGRTTGTKPLTLTPLTPIVILQDAILVSFNAFM